MPACHWLLLWVLGLQHAIALETVAAPDDIDSVNFLRPKPWTTAAPAASRSPSTTLSAGLATPNDLMPQYFSKRLLVVCLILSVVVLVILHILMIRHLPKEDSEQSFSDTGDLGSMSSSNSAKSKEQLPMERMNTAARHGHKVLVFKYYAITFWCVLLWAGAVATRLWCHFGIPKDCQPHTELVQFVAENHMLVGYSFILGILVGIPNESRFGYVFDFRWRPSEHTGVVISRGWAFMVLFFVSVPAYGALDLIPFLSRFSLTDNTIMGSGYGILLYCLVFGFVGIAGWHLIYAFLINNFEGFCVYTLWRLLIWIVFAAYFFGAHQATYASFHLHHYIVGFIFAVLAEFNHPISLVLLAVASAVMCQGIGAYGADAIYAIDVQDAH